MPQILLVIMGIMYGVLAGSSNATPTLSGQPLVLGVPFTSEIPDGSWVKPWNNACEEASITMVEAWYNKKDTLTKTEAKAAMQQLFTWEDAHFGGNANTDATQTVQLITAKAGFSARIVRNPSLQDIQNELRAGRPVITLNYGYDLKNPLHHWARNGSYYHMMVIAGFDDGTKEFLVNDTALEEGLDYRYSYATILNSLHDYDPVRKKTDGPPTVLFTGELASPTSTLLK